MLVYTHTHMVKATPAVLPLLVKEVIPLLHRELSLLILLLAKIFLRQD